MPAGLVFSGVVLAAGRSSRMGRDKALLEAGGVPLWQRQRDLLTAAGAAEVYLSARPEQAWAPQAGGFAGVLHDGVPEAGPLMGITEAIERTPRGHLAVLAIDLPAMTATWFHGLAEACGPGVGAVGRHGGGFEPLAAIYPRELMPLAWEAIARGDYAVQRVIAAGIAHGLLQAREIAAGEMGLFANWNEGGERRKARGERLEAKGGRHFTGRGAGG